MFNFSMIGEIWYPQALACDQVKPEGCGYRL
jgi:hypothetical protein